MPARYPESGGLMAAVLSLAFSALLALSISRGDAALTGFVLAAGASLGTLLWYESLSFPLLVLTFFWAGMRVPFSGMAETARWVVLAVCAALGVLCWGAARKPFHFGNLHLFAIMTISAFLLSYDVSPNPTLTLMKSVSVALLFVYCSTGALVYIDSIEKSLLRVATVIGEVLVYGTLVSYYLVDLPIFGNPNSLGAVMGCIAWPVLFWSALNARDPGQRYRGACSLLVCGFLLQHSLARAAIGAAAVSSLLVLFAMRRYRLMAGFVLGMCLAGLAMTTFMPNQWRTLVQGVVYKKSPGTEILQSRQTRWDESVDNIQRRPWFGNGFGASKDISEEWRGGFTTGGLSREHGNSYLGIVAGVGFAGAIGPGLLLGFLVELMRRACVRTRRSRDGSDRSIMMSALLAAGLCHAFFEDWLFAAGYYLCVVFWVTAFALADRESRMAEKGPGCACS
jgi:hypothetical protein